MSFFSKIGGALKGAVKAVGKVAAPLAVGAMAIPGIGTAVGGVASVVGGLFGKVQNSANQSATAAQTAAAQAGLAYGSERGIGNLVPLALAGAAAWVIFNPKKGRR